MGREIIWKFTRQDKVYKFIGKNYLSLLSVIHNLPGCKLKSWNWTRRVSSI
jgi:hypothetical protein